KLMAMGIGAVGAGVMIGATIALNKMKIDDVVGALSVHLVAGIWGTLAVAIFSTGNYAAQLAGIGAVGLFVTVVSAIVWLVLKYTVGIRVDEREERYGLDMAEVGLEAYPDFEIRRAG
ncbi:MAG: ammonium transporter, partial [Alphaproteobacteria bacterium]|nr:ammonium transporter [Alphaproteobacteria bacterium]